MVVIDLVHTVLVNVVLEAHLRILVDVCAVSRFCNPILRISLCLVHLMYGGDFLGMVDFC